MASKPLLAALLAAVFTGCGPAASHDAIDLSRRISSDVRDWQAHRDLARLASSEGKEGLALKEYLALERLQKLEPADRQALGLLLQKRAEARLKLRDPGSLTDQEHAIRLGVDADLREHLALAAVHALRHSSSFEQEQATSLLTRLHKLDSLDSRAKQAEADTSSSATQLVLLNWFAEAGAKRQALRVAKIYVASGGRDDKALALWLDLHQWWYGDRFPALPSDAAALVPSKPGPEAKFLRQLQDPVEVSHDLDKLATRWKKPQWAPILQQIRQHYAQDPALSDRSANEFVEISVYGAMRMAILVELYYGLGDTGRARQWGVRLSELSPTMASFQMTAALSSAVDGDTGRAEQLFIAAAAASGDPGQYWAMAVHTLTRAGHNLSAVHAARQALSLTRRGSDLPILLNLLHAQKALGRDNDAEQTLAAMLDRLPATLRQESRPLLLADGVIAEPALLERLWLSAPL